MSSNHRAPSSSLLRLVALAATLVAAIQAADTDVRIAPQLVVGTAGVEPGLALELRPAASPQIIVRPELLISEDGQLGAGGAVLVDASAALALPKRQALAIGPRVVYHHADDTGWEAGLLATWSFELSSDVRAWRHAVGALAAVGVCEDRRHDDVDLGATAGVFYAFRF